MDDSIATQHLSISILAWLIGGVTGAMVGYLVASLMHRLFFWLPILRGLFMLFPWRTIIVNLLLFGLIFLSRRAVILNILHLAASPLAFTLADLGPRVDAIPVAFLIFLLAFPLTALMLLERHHPSALGVRIVAGARTLLILSIVLTVLVGTFSGQGLGAFVTRRLGLFDFNTALNEWGRVIGWVFRVDFVGGILQLILFYIVARRQAKRPATGGG